MTIPADMAVLFRKDREARNVPICDELYQILVRYRCDDGFILRPQRSREKRGGSKRVYRYDPVKLWQRVLMRAVEAGVPRIRFHDMRHSFASLLLNSGVSADKVAKWLGHADTRMVHKTYGHLLAYDDDINRLALVS